MLARTMVRVIGPHAKLPTFLAAIVYLNFNVAVFGGFQLESLQSFFAIIAACAAIEALMGDNVWDSFWWEWPAAARPCSSRRGSLSRRRWRCDDCKAARRATMHGALAMAGLAYRCGGALLLIGSDALGDMPGIIGSSRRTRASRRGMRFR